MEDFNLPDPQNDRRAAQAQPQAPVTQNAPPVPSPVNPPQNQQPVSPPPAPQYQPPVNPPQSQQQSQQQYQQPQQPNYQQGYQQPMTNQQHAAYQKTNRLYPPMKTGQWMLTIFLTGIPLVGFILLLVWAFSSDTNPSKSAWARATLLWGVIISVIYVFIYVLLVVIMGLSNGFDFIS